MADPTFQASPLNVLGGVAQVEQIKGARQARDLATQRLAFQQEQAVLQEQNRVKAENIKIIGNQLDSAEEEITKAQSPIVIRQLGSSINRLRGEMASITGVDATPFNFDTIAEDATVRKQFQTDLSGLSAVSKRLGSQHPDVLAIRDAINIKHFKTPGAAAAVQAVASPTAKEEFATEKAQQRELGELEIEQKVSLEEQRQKIARSSAQTLQQEQQKALNERIDKSNLDPETKEILKLGFGAGVTSQLLADPDVKETIKEVTLGFDEFGEPKKGFARIFVDESGEFKFQIATEVEPAPVAAPTPAPPPTTQQPTPQPTKIPTAKEFIEAARASNPDSTDDELLEFWENKYGVEFRPAPTKFSETDVKAVENAKDFIKRKRKETPEVSDEELLLEWERLNNREFRPAPTKTRHSLRMN
jgi:hypothetical protein